VSEEQAEELISVELQIDWEGTVAIWDRNGHRQVNG
jgi:hypothetical protein